MFQVLAKAGIVAAQSSEEGRSSVGVRKAGLFNRLEIGNLEFRGLAEKYRELDQKITEYDRIYYLTSEQERKRKELQERQLSLKDQMSRIMRQHAEAHGRNGSVVSAFAS